MSAMDHVRYLADTIGPRGSTTPQEAEAAEYAAQILKQAGLEPITETFTSARSAWYPYVIFSGLILVSEFLFWLGGRWGAVAALIVSVLAVFSVLVELTFHSNPIRWLLPKAESQNVWARIPPRAMAREQLVLIGHLDSHRTPLAFSSDRWVRLFSTLVPVGLISALVIIVLFAIGIASSDSLWRFLTLPFSLVILGIFMITLQADFTPFTAGANDNASGAAIALSLAEKIKSDPLTNTVVWLVLSGCEETGCYGAEAFARNHRDELGSAIWIAIDSVGGKGAVPAYITTETFLMTTRSDPELLALADRVAERRPDLEAQPKDFRGAYTEGVIGAKFNHRVLSFISFRRDGVLPEWHRSTDVVENVDPEVVARTESFLWELLLEVDRRAISPG